MKKRLLPLMLALALCLGLAVPALAGNVTGWLYRRAASKKKS